MIAEVDVVPGLKELAAFEIGPTETINPAVVYIESLGSEISKRTMISPLNRAASVIRESVTGKDAWRMIPWQKISAPAIRAVMAEVTGSPATRNKTLAALKGVARSAWELKQIDTDELMRIRGIKGDSGTREVAGRFVPAGEISELLRNCATDNSPSGARDAAMLALATATGARRAEIASIQLENVQFHDEGRFTIRIIGKRNKERTLHVTGNAARTLTDWLGIRGATGCISGPLFCAIRKGGTILHAAPVSTTALDKILQKRGEQANVANLDWHDLRRTTASNLLDAGADITTVAGMLGHSNVQTTARYDRRGERARIKASELISVPYFGRI